MHIVRAHNNVRVCIQDDDTFGCEHEGVHNVVLWVVFSKCRSGIVQRQVCMKSHNSSLVQDS